MTNTYLLIALIILHLAALAAWFFRRRNGTDATAFRPMAESILDEVRRMESSLRDEFTRQRGESGRDSQALREEVTTRMENFRVAIENRSDVRALPSVMLVGQRLEDLLAKRRPFLTAKRLLSNQTFRDIYRTDTLDLNQRLKITSLTFLFTDLKGSTELYERVGDLVAFDLVRSHFQVLNEIIATEAGAVVKTIGDAVMATFPTPDRAVAVALRMRNAMKELNSKNGREDLLLKIGVHEGPCIAVTMNERQDYFGQTVNIASRVQGLANSQAIFATGSVIDDTKTADLLQRQSLMPKSHNVALRGIEREVLVYAIPESEMTGPRPAA